MYENCLKYQLCTYDKYFQSSQDVPSINHNTKAYFFDNPRRYDSDDEDISVRNEPHQRSLLRKNLFFLIYYHLIYK